MWKQYDKAIEYYKMVVNSIIANDLERYILYQNHNIEYDGLLTEDIKIYQHKIDNFKSIETCKICYDDDKTCITMNCLNHYVCTDCYIKLYDKPCPFCRFE